MSTFSHADISASSLPLVRFEQVCFSYDDYARVNSSSKISRGGPIIDNLNFDLPSGKLIALLGPNGAGKSTSIGLLTGALTPQRGQVRLWNHDPKSQSVRQRMGVTPQELDFPRTLRVNEILKFVAGHYPAPLAVENIADRVGLSNHLGRSAGALSGGETRRLALACAFVGNPEFVVLDEPTTGLDVESRRLLWELLRQFVKDGGSILLTTHYLEEAEQLADEILVFHRGQIQARGSVEEMKSQFHVTEIRFECDLAVEIHGPHQVSRQNSRYTVLSTDPDQYVRGLVRMNLPFRHLSVERASLEDVFLHLAREKSLLQGERTQ